MFDYADKDEDGKISWTEFQIMINPPKPPEPEKPTMADLVTRINAQEPKGISVMKRIADKEPELRMETSWSSIVRGTPS